MEKYPTTESLNKATEQAKEKKANGNLEGEQELAEIKDYVSDHLNRLNYEATEDEINTKEYRENIDKLLELLNSEGFDNFSISMRIFKDILSKMKSQENLLPEEEKFLSDIIESDRIKEEETGFLTSTNILTEMKDIIFLLRAFKQEPHMPGLWDGPDYNHVKDKLKEARKKLFEKQLENLKGIARII
jgi:hypothetical protein